MRLILRQTTAVERERGGFTSAGTVGSVTLDPVAYARERGATGSQARLELHAKSCWRDHASVSRIVSQLARSESREDVPPSFRPVGSEPLPALFFQLPKSCGRCLPGSLQRRESPSANPKAGCQ